MMKRILGFFAALVDKLSSVTINATTFAKHMGTIYLPFFSFFFFFFSALVSFGFVFFSLRLSLLAMILSPVLPVFSFKSQGFC